MRINLIYAKSANNVIGDMGNLPWSIPEDMQYFMHMTNQCTVIMGRKTWESIPVQFRPLKSRKNIIISNNPKYIAIGATVCDTVNQAIASADTEEVWIIGGKLVYDLFLGRATRAFVTEIHEDYDGDTIAPTLDPSIWNEVSRNKNISVSGINFDFVEYNKEQ